MENHGLTDIDRIKLLIPPPELSGSPTNRVSSNKSGEIDKGNYEFLPYEVSVSYF
jgi:hypothetical protein